MGFKKLWFPIALAILWVVMAAMAMSDFASFDATTRPQRAVAQKAVGARPMGRTVKLALR